MYVHMNQLLRGTKRLIRESARFAHRKPLIALAIFGFALLNPVLGIAGLVFFAYVMGQD